MTAPRTSAGPRAPAAGGALVIAIVAGGTFLAPINSTMIAVALPALMTAFGVGVTGISWIVTVYLLTMASLQPVAGRLGDLYGHRRLFLLGGLGLAGASVACAFASTLPALVACRAVQGAGAALMSPNGTAIVRHASRPSLGRALGWLAGLMGVGAAIGPALGALLIHYCGWASIFWVNLPVLAVVLPLAARYLPDTPRGHGTRFDVVGAVLLTAALACGVAALSRLHRGLLSSLAGAGVAAALGLLFYGWERRQRAPIVDFRLFRHPGFAAASLAILLTNLAMYTTLLVAPLMMVGLQHRGPVTVGGVLLLYSSVMSAAAPLGGYVSDRFGRAAPVGVGTLLLLAGTGGLLWAGADASLVALTTSLGVGAAGVGLQVGAEQSAALESAPREMTGAAGGVWATSRYLGAILGSVLLGLLVGGGLDPSGFRRVLYLVAGASLMLVPVGAVLRLSGRPLGLLAGTRGPSGPGAAPTPSIPGPD